MIDRPVRFGPNFKRPSARTVRLRKAEVGPKVFEPQQVRDLIDQATWQMRAMILLGINCGLGNADVGQMEFRHVDLLGGWLSYPRPKTGILRRGKLWPMTVDALVVAKEKRHEPKDEGLEDRFFITKRGKSFYKDSPDNPIANEFRKLLNVVGISRRGVGFYWLRHTFETVAGNTRDQVAVDYCMGHVDTSMAGNYRHGIDDERFEVIASHVLTWLSASGAQR
ncbi:MAG: hypothetical protein R3C28_13095 [Pirellulaceae bacterium]